MSSVPFRSALILLPGEASPQAHLSVPQASGPAFSFLPSGSVFVGLSRGQRWGSARPQKPSRRGSRWGTETPLITVLSPGARRPPAPGPQASPSCPSRLSLSSPHSCHLQGPPWLTTKSDLLFVRCIAFLVAPQPQITATVCFLPTAALGVCCTPHTPVIATPCRGQDLAGSLSHCRMRGFCTSTSRRPDQGGAFDAGAYSGPPGVVLAVGGVTPGMRTGVRTGVGQDHSRSRAVGLRCSRGRS